MPMETGIIFDIAHGSFVDGPGIRTTVFFKGCNLRCAWCHNPESQAFSPELLHYRDQCISCGKCESICHRDSCILCGTCALYCPVSARELCGKSVSLQEVMDEILIDRDFYGQTGGLTVSGGECMLQPDFLESLLKAAKRKGIHTAVDTAGNVPWSVFERILPYTDLFLYDVKSMDSAVHRQYTGVENTLILQNLQELLRRRTPLWIRMPIIPGVNDTQQEMTALRSFLDQHGQPEKIELLPYHAMGENKARALDREPVCFPVPAADYMERLRAILKE